MSAPSVKVVSSGRGASIPASCQAGSAAARGLQLPERAVDRVAAAAAAASDCWSPPRSIPFSISLAGGLDLGDHAVLIVAEIISARPLSASAMRAVGEGDDDDLRLLEDVAGDAEGGGQAELLPPGLQRRAWAISSSRRCRSGGTTSRPRTSPERRTARRCSRPWRSSASCRATPATDPSRTRRARRTQATIVRICTK